MTQLRRRAVDSPEIDLNELEAASATSITYIETTTSSTYSNDVKDVDDGDLSLRLSRQSDIQPIALISYSSKRPYHNINKNPLKSGKDGAGRLSTSRRGDIDGAVAVAVAGVKGPSSSTTTLESHYENPLEVNALWYKTGVSYFPDQVAIVSYTASVVKPDAEGDYLKDLQGGMDLLATRLAPAHFPGTFVQDVTTQVDGYIPAACPSGKFKNCQHVTASIGIYLKTLPSITKGEFDTNYFHKDGSNSSIETVNVVVDPSTMTEELIAFQESFEAAIANNELQDAIREDYSQKHYEDSRPPIMIVTVPEIIPPIIENDTKDKGNDDISNIIGSDGDIDDEIETETHSVVDHEYNEGNDGTTTTTNIGVDNDNETEIIVDNQNIEGNSNNGNSISISIDDIDVDNENESETGVNNENEDNSNNGNSISIDIDVDNENESESESETVVNNNENEDNSNNGNSITSIDMDMDIDVDNDNDNENESETIVNNENEGNSNNGNSISIDIDVDNENESETIVNNKNEDNGSSSSSNNNGIGVDGETTEIETVENNGNDDDTSSNINNINIDDDTNIGTEINTDNGISSVTTSSATEEPFTAMNPSSSVAAEATSKDAGMGTGGIIGTVLVILLLVSAIIVLALVRRRTRKDRHSDWDKKKKNANRRANNGSSSNSNNKKQRRNDDDCCNDSDYDQSQQNLLINAYDSDDEGGDEEDGLTGRTMRTVVSGSTNTTDEMLLPVVVTSSSSLSFGSSCVSLSRSNGNTILPILEHDYEEEEGKMVDNLVSQAVVASDDVISFDATSNNVKNEVYNNNDDDGDGEEGNDYIVGEDDDSNSSVGEQLLCASRSSDLCISASTSADLIHNTSPASGITTPTVVVSAAAAAATTTTTPDITAAAVASLETRKETITGDFSKSRKHISLTSMSSDGGSSAGIDSGLSLSELDIAIASGDWATVGATAALMATTTSAKRSRRKKQSSSASSVTSNEFSQKAAELDRLIDAGDWQAVVVVAAQYDAEGESTVGGEDASRSCRSRTSTQGSDAQGSDAMDSYVSNTDYSSVDRSFSMGRSVTTSASQKERLQEIRAQVTQMVQDIVPDEVDNVDEMMNQFKGKEEELLETLRTMKERNVAKKARLESQKIARRNTRSRDKKEGFPSSATTATTATTTPSAKLGFGLPVNEDTETESPEVILASSDSNDDDVSLPPVSSSITSDNDEETDETGYYTAKEYGSFENTQRIDPDTAAAAAAAWAIQRSLDRMIEKEEKGLE